MNSLREKISVKTASIGFLVISGIALVYHFLVINQVISYKYVWGGRLESVDQMYSYELSSVMAQLIFIIIILIYTKSNANSKVHRLIKYILYIISGLFLLNTIGNIFALQLAETIFFTPLTILSCLFTLRLAVE